MSLSKPVVDFPTTGAGKGNRTPVEPPIALIRADNATLREGQYHTYKLRTNPTSATSSTYELDVPLFSTGTVEEWLRFRNNLGRVVRGQNATGPGAKFALARRLLESEALLATFNNHAATDTETNETFEECLDKVGNLIFPKRALQSQKRYMRRNLRKPGTMKTCTYVARIMELNNYLPLFPRLADGVEPTKLAEDEIKDLLEFGMPKSYQRAMALQGFDPMIHTITEFVEFCERLEAVETYDAPTKPAGNLKGSNKTSNKNSKRKREGNTANPVSETDTANYFCLLHGDNPTHNTDNCYALKNSVKKMKSGTESTGNTKSNSNKYPGGKDLHAIIATAVSTAFKEAKGTDRKRKSRTNKNSASEEIKQFEQLSLSGNSSYRDESDASVSSSSSVE